MPISHLPVEIHVLIASYLSSKDLPNYRSACKCFADIGAQYLFQDLTFHAAHASINRINSVGLREDLKGNVHTITWDTGSVDVNVTDFGEWHYRLRVLRRQELAAAQEALRRELPDENDVRKAMEIFLRGEYEKYKVLVREEREVQSQRLSGLTDHLVHFPKLKRIIVTKQQRSHEDGLVMRDRDRGLVERGILACRAPYKHSQDMFPFVTALKAAQDTTQQLEVRSLNFGVFSQSVYNEHLHHIDTSHVSRLRLHFAMTDPSSDPLESSMSIMNCKRVLAQGHLKKFLLKFQNLQALGLDFEARSHGNGRAPVNLHDIFSLDHQWRSLRELAIYHVDTPASVFARFIENHAASLERLALGDICLDPPDSWVVLLSNLQPQLRLGSADFEYFLFDARIENLLRVRSAMIGWYCDSEVSAEEDSDLGKRLEKYLVEGGGCPLREERKIARVVGRLENQRIDDWLHNRHISLLT